jgi:hypothetical protein
VNGALRSDKLDGECVEAQTILTRYRSKTSVATNAELRHVYHTWDPRAAALIDI